MSVRNKVERQLKEIMKEEINKKKRNNNRKYGGEEDKQNEVKERDRSIKLESRIFCLIE